MKTLIVREAFGLNGQDYARGSEITDPVQIEAVLVSHGHHVVRTPHDAPAAKAAAPADDDAK